MSLALVTHLVAVAVAAGGVWFFQEARWHADVAEVRLEASEEKLQAVARTRAGERAINKTYVEALNEARTRAIALGRDRDAARAESDGLREQAAGAARRFASAPPAAVVEYAATVNQLFAECSRGYQGMAEKADGHAADVRAFTDAWPVMRR
ncbi:MAG: hypothetical protein F9K35_16035 [Burkholderiaceae bacterium]|nr:MAG: hypothetical protein F9K35_16035 [Burkholderiaceae bacterium]